MRCRAHVHRKTLIPKASFPEKTSRTSSALPSVSSHSISNATRAKFVYRCLGNNETLENLKLPAPWLFDLDRAAFRHVVIGAISSDDTQPTPFIHTTASIESLQQQQLGEWRRHSYCGQSIKIDLKEYNAADVIELYDFVDQLPYFHPAVPASDEYDEALLQICRAVAFREKAVLLLRMPKPTEITPIDWWGNGLVVDALQALFFLEC
jgi:hypothetical protein